MAALRSAVRSAFARLTSLFRRRQLDRDLSAELESHLQLHIDDNLRAGMSLSEARRQALLKLGGPQQTKESVRDRAGFVFLEDLFRDVRLAIRNLRKSSGFTVTVLLTLALGIGANTALFQLLDAVRMRTLPVANPQQLATVQIVGGNHGMGVNQMFGELSRPLWQEIRDRQKSMSGLFAWSVAQRYIGRGSDMRHFNGLWVSGEFFSSLGIHPYRGRLLLPEDETSCPVTRAVASYSFWQNELGGRDISSGIRMIASNDLVEIVGVTPPQFTGLVVGDYFDLALPFCKQSEPLRNDAFEVSVVGRLRPGVTLDDASAELATLSPSIFEATLPAYRDAQSERIWKLFRLAAYPAARGAIPLTDDDFASLWLLQGITGLVLLIACANLANLMLVRAKVREREMAVRLSLGAPRKRLIRQLLTESLLLTVAGAAAGIFMAKLFSQTLLLMFSTENNVIRLDLSLDWRVLLFFFLVAMSTCLIFGLIPAIRSSGMQPNSALKSEGRGTTSGRSHLSLQRFLVVVQISVSLVLLVSAFLLVRSFRNLVTLNPGIREQGITVAFCGFWQSNMPKERWANYEAEMLSDVRSVPGIISAATTTNVPLTGSSWTHSVTIGSVLDSSKFAWVSPEYFSTMGIPITHGRGFTNQDTASSARVVLVNQTFLRTFHLGSNPLGTVLRTSSEPDYPSTDYTIIGVIPDTQYNDLKSPTPPMAFAPAAQFPAQGPWASILIYSDLPYAKIVPTVKRRLSETHPDALLEFTDFHRQIMDNLIMERTMATLSGFFGLLAALLAAIGLYGVISYIVLSRRNELGIRMALGATPGKIQSEVLLWGARLAAIGLMVGIVVVLAGRGILSSLLFGIASTDAGTLMAAVLFMLAIAALASYLPARRATRVDPLVALRYE